VPYIEYGDGGGGGDGEMVE